MHFPERLPRPGARALATLLLLGATARAATSDRHDHLLETNRAQIVMLAQRGLLPPAEATRIAQALRTIGGERAAQTGPRSSNYLDLEARLTQLIGPEASDIHLGRSRNDLGEAMNRMLMRERLLDIADTLFAARAVVQRIAAEHIDTVMPGFTHAVQAQPTTLAHFLLAFDASLARDTERLRQAYRRVNLSPLGAGAFTTSGFALDREMLAALLGFDGLVENAYDAIMVSAADSKVEFSAVLGLSALNIGRFAQYLLFQYDDPSPGLLLTGSIVSHSSIMPQKRNPSAIERLRLSASEVVANAQAAAFFVHNTPLYEVKDAREDHLTRLLRFADEAKQMYAALTRVLESLTVRKEILREQVDRDYATMTELADTLHRDAKVPFRIGYKVASELSTYGRARGKRPLELTHAEVDAIFQRIAGERLPLDEAQLKRAMDPAEIIRSRRGRGGPQPDEANRMLGEQRAELAGARAWIAAERQRFDDAARRLDREFEALAGQPAR